MASIYIIRHQESEGNRRGIIQGRTFDPPLTDEGVIQAELLARTREFSLVTTVLCSPSRRAKQTAEIIAAALRRPLRIDDIIVEFDAGVLSGLNPDEARARYPEAYDIWLQRKDLDGISGAESGDMLQARTILFLEQYLHKDADELVVSHAGFIRCLINTASGRPRTTPIDIDHDVVHRIDNPMKHLSLFSLTLGRGSRAVYRITTSDSAYILKINEPYIPQRALFQKLLATHLSRFSTLTPRVYISRERDGRDVKVLEYIDGVHRYGPLSPKQEEEIVMTARTFQNSLSHFVIPEEAKPISLDEKINQVESCLSTTCFADIYSYLKNHPSWNSLREKSHVIANYDLHRSNLLFTSKGVCVIDNESYLLAPTSFFPASLLMSCFLLEQPERDMRTLTELWPEHIDSRELSIGMLSRSLIGISFFVTRATLGGTRDDADLLCRYALGARNIMKYLQSL